MRRSFLSIGLICCRASRRRLSRDDRKMLRDWSQWTSEHHLTTGSAHKAENSAACLLANARWRACLILVRTNSSRSLLAVCFAYHLVRTAERRVKAPRSAKRQYIGPHDHDKIRIGESCLQKSRHQEVLRSFLHKDAFRVVPIGMPGGA